MNLKITAGHVSGILRLKTTNTNNKNLSVYDNFPCDAKKK